MVRPIFEPMLFINEFSMLSFIKENLFLFIIIFLLIVAPSFLLGAVQIIVYIILGLFILAIIGTLAIKWRVRKFQKEYNSQYQYNDFSEYADPTIKVNVTRPAEEKKVSPEVGDYVDFEEIKEK